MERAVQDRINILRPLMIFGVVILHTPAFVPITEVGADWFSLLKAFFQNAMFRTTVPMLTLISGYLLFHAGLDQSPKALWAKKARSLLLPFLAFNIPLLVAAVLAQLLTGLNMAYKLVPFDSAVWMDAAFGVSHSPINYPLNFLRDLIALMLLAPLMGLLIRRAAIPGLLIVLVVFLQDFDGKLVARNLMPIMFYIGGMAACKKWNLRALDAYALPCFAAFITLCAAIIHFQIVNTTVLRLVSPFLIWPMCSVLVGTRIGNWCGRMNKYSFFLFLIHAPILFASWAVYQRFGRALPYGVYWVATPFVILAIVVMLYQLAMSVMPGVFASLIGGRVRKDEKPQRPAFSPLGLPEQAITQPEDQVPCLPQ